MKEQHQLALTDARIVQADAVHLGVVVFERASRGLCMRTSRDGESQEAGKNPHGASHLSSPFTPDTTGRSSAVIEIHQQEVFPGVNSNRPVGVGSVVGIALIEVVKLTVDVVNAGDSVERVWIGMQMPHGDELLLQILVRGRDLPTAPR